MTKPMLFNTDMVRAIQAERKTVTRRVVKPQPEFSILADRKGRMPLSYWADNERWVKPPYQPGDILYVRETWRVQSARRFDAHVKIEFKAGGYMVGIQFPGRCDQCHSRREYDAFVARWADNRWHPSIHMPRKAARIFLRVTDVRVERLWAVEAEDVLAEGVIPTGRSGGCRCQWAFDGCMDGPCSNRTAYEIERYIVPFAQLWDSTIKPADCACYGWEANPWVWVIEFERCEKPKEDT